MRSRTLVSLGVSCRVNAGSGPHPYPLRQLARALSVFVGRPAMLPPLCGRGNPLGEAHR